MFLTILYYLSSVIVFDELTKSAELEQHTAEVARDETKLVL